jgi:hypothetical protein
MGISSGLLRWRPDHALLQNTESSGLIELFPAHPHEGAVGLPADEHSASVVETYPEVTRTTFLLASVGVSL